MRKSRILIVIPVYNHGLTLPAVVQSALATGYKVLVVDDGSDDNGLSDLADMPCRTLRLNKNTGKGAALLKGAKYAARFNYDAIITVDADGQHDPADIPLLVAEAERCDGACLIIGARQMTEDTVPRSSHFGKAFSNFWVRLECGLELPDTQSGFRYYPLKELLSLQLERYRYDFEIEALVKLAWAGVHIGSVPVKVHYPPGDERISHFHKIKDNFRLTRLHSNLVARRLFPWPYRGLKTTRSASTNGGTPFSANPFKILGKICKEHTSPLGLATAVWLGIFMGALPLLAVHTVAILYVAHRLHLNKVAAVAASQFCMPPVVPVLCIQVGYYLRNGQFLFDLSWQRWLLEIHERLWEWLIGSLLIGPILGLIGGALVYKMVPRLNNSNESSPTGA